MENQNKTVSHIRTPFFMISFVFFFFMFFLQCVMFSNIYYACNTKPVLYANIRVYKGIDAEREVWSNIYIYIY